MNHHKTFVLNSSAEKLDTLARELIEASRSPNKAEAACLCAALELRHEAKFLRDQIDAEVPC
jgi:hypothetical protein